MGYQLKFLDLLGEIKNELVEIKDLAQTKETREVEVFFLAIPEAGGTRQFQIGTTSIDFRSGVIVNPDGSKEYLNLSLDTFQQIFARCITVDSDKDIMLRILPYKTREVKADHTIQIEYLTYNKIEIVCTQLTNIKIWASTHPRNTVSEFKGAANLTQTNIDGDLIEAQSLDTVYSLLNNLNRIRNQIKGIKGSTNWYDEAHLNLSNLIFQVRYDNHTGQTDNMAFVFTAANGTATSTVHQMALNTGLTHDLYLNNAAFYIAVSTPLNVTGVDKKICNFIIKDFVPGDGAGSPRGFVGWLESFAVNWATRRRVGFYFNSLGSVSINVNINAGETDIPIALPASGSLLTIVVENINSVVTALFYVNKLLVGTIPLDNNSWPMVCGAGVQSTSGSPAGTHGHQLTVDYMSFQI